MNIITEVYDYGTAVVFSCELGNVRNGVIVRRRFNPRHPLPEKSRAAAVKMLRDWLKDRKRNGHRIRADLRPCNKRRTGTREGSRHA